MGPLAETRSSLQARRLGVPAWCAGAVAVLTFLAGVRHAAAGDARRTAVSDTTSAVPSTHPTALRSKADRPVPPPPGPAAPIAPPEQGKCIRVRADGRVFVARVHGQNAEQTSVYLPDGQLGFARGLAYTDEPFRPATFDEMRRDLQAGQFKDFVVHQTPHYLIFYQSSATFATDSGRLLEALYKGISDAFRKQDVPTRDAEFPLVAVIFRDEKDFRAFKPVAPEVQAYYEILTNRIYFYERSTHDQAAPEVAALRRPQTVAHEGTHQILSNIGIQPRLGAWPMWLVEGLAEYCSPPITTKKGEIAWKGLGEVNPMHMATIRDLDDQAALNVGSGDRPLLGRDPRQPLVEYVVTKEELTPTDYALAWAVTHYLAHHRLKEFVAFLAKMSTMPPLEPRSPEQHLAEFRAAFGNDLVKLNKAIGTYLAKLKYKELPYYAVFFEQPMGPNRLRRAAMVSQSPLVIRQWIETVTNPQGGESHWEAHPLSTRTKAMIYADQWLRSR
ncbi:MAG: DUF1570 domain-containing protein [Isosphaeraceae bacterium]|nr:DUF1570 domain-containing protein [Isosphaeraceae bacterium]